jgi:hypothetical protein
VQSRLAGDVFAHNLFDRRLISDENAKSADVVATLKFLVAGRLS